MRTSLLETKQLEDHILGRDSGEEALLMQVKLHLDEGLRSKLAAQQQAYDYIQAYGRKKLKAEIAAVHHRLFHEEEHRGFRDRIKRIFHI